MVMQDATRPGSHPDQHNRMGGPWRLDGHNRPVHAAPMPEYRRHLTHEDQQQEAVQNSWGAKENSRGAPPKSLSSAWNELFVHSAAASANSGPHQSHVAGAAKLFRCNLLVSSSIG